MKNGHYLAAFKSALLAKSQLQDNGKLRLGKTCHLLGKTCHLNEPTVGLPGELLVIRQRDSRHRQAVSRLAKGEIEKGLRLFEPEIHETDPGSMNGKAATLYKQTQDPRTPIIVQTNAQKIEINNIIKTALGPKSQGTEHKIWRPVHMSKSERARTETYEAGSHIRFNRDIKRFRINRGDIFKITSIDKERSAIELKHVPDRKSVLSRVLKKTRTFIPAKYELGDGTVELYDQSVVTLHESDRVRFTRGGRSRAVNNNDFGFIRGVSGKQITIELDKGETLTLPLSAPELRHMDHGWATTCHAYQGKTVENAIVVIPSRANPLTTLASLYVGTSRHTYGVALITDDKEKLRGSIEQALDRSLALSKAFRPEAGPSGTAASTLEPSMGGSQDERSMDSTGTYDLGGLQEKALGPEKEPDLVASKDLAKETKTKRPEHNFRELDPEEAAAVKAWSDWLDRKEASPPDRSQERNIPDNDYER